MAAGVCVTSFRMLMRHSDVSHLSRIRGLRLTPITTTTLTMNSWNLRGRGYCKERDSDSEEVKESKDSGKTNSKTASPLQNYVHVQILENVKSPTSSRGIANKASNIHNSNDINLKATDLSQMKLAQLKACLSANGLSANGRKEILIDRLRNHLQQQQQQQQLEENTQMAANNMEQFTQHVKHNKENEPKTSFSSSSSSPSYTTLIAEQSAAPTVTQVQAPSTAERNELRSSSAELPLNLSTLTLSTSDSAASTTDTNTHIEDINYATVHTAHRNEKMRKNAEVIVEYIQGLPHITVPLPSRNEKCRFALMPVSHRVGDLVEMLKDEDRGIDRATVMNKCGVRIASTCNIESLMDEPFWLQINENKYKVTPPKRQKIASEDIDRLGDVRSLVSQLYAALHVGEYHIQKEKDLTTQLEHLKFQLAPLENKKLELGTQADRKTTLMAWAGLGLMSLQFGILARLTWWEYSWDIMEPVTYFVTYGTAIAMYAYYCITKSEYNYSAIKERTYLLHMHKNAKKKSFDIEEYNNIKRQVAEIEYDLRRLRDPLNLQLPSPAERVAAAVPPSLPATTPIKQKVASDKDSKKTSFKLPFLTTKKSD